MDQSERDLEKQWQLRHPNSRDNMAKAYWKSTHVKDWIASKIRAEIRKPEYANLPKHLKSATMLKLEKRFELEGNALKKKWANNAINEFRKKYDTLFSGGSIPKNTSRYTLYAQAMRDWKKLKGLTGVADTNLRRKTADFVRKGYKEEKAKLPKPKPGTIKPGYRILGGMRVRPIAPMRFRPITPDTAREPTKRVTPEIKKGIGGIRALGMDRSTQTQHRPITRHPTQGGYQGTTPPATQKPKKRAGNGGYSGGATFRGV